jgi:2-polyprenyl-3-methyl-5-hydroxy-6-metoxy-1,4-benzoquinol methylase
MITDEYGSAVAPDYQVWVNGLAVAKHVDDYTLLNMAGNVTGKAILEIGCGTGNCTKPLKRMGARRVVGLDCSPAMLQVAQAEEDRSPLGIEYIVGDMFAPAIVGSFDLVVASGVLSVSPTREHLLKAGQMAFNNLTAGGRFIVFDMNPELSPKVYPLCEKYGFKLSTLGPLEEGAIIVCSIPAGDKQLVFHSYYHSHADYEWALRTAGFQTIRWRRPMVSPEGLQEFGEEFWHDYVECPMSIYLECVKG